MASSLALKVAKKELRTAMKPLLSTIPTAVLESQSKAAFKALTTLKAYQDARNISIYLSMPSGEIQTDAIVRHALSAGKQVFIPFLHANTAGAKGTAEGETAPKRVMDMVGLRDLSDYEGLERDSWGIPTVAEGAVGRRRVLGKDGGVSQSGDREGLDLMLLPGVAFELQRDGSERGKVRRLGHGRGFYDFFLYWYQKVQAESGSEGKLQLYGLALEDQFLQDGEAYKVPVGAHDHFLDGLIVGDGHVVDSLAAER